MVVSWRPLGTFWLLLGCSGGAPRGSWWSLGGLLGPACGFPRFSFSKGSKKRKTRGSFLAPKRVRFRDHFEKEKRGKPEAGPKRPLEAPKRPPRAPWSDLGAFLVPADKPKMVKIHWFYHYFCKIASWIKNVLRKASWTQLEATWATKSAKWPSKRCPKNVQEELKIVSKNERKKGYQNRGPRHRLTVLLLGPWAPWGGVGEGKNKH